MGISNRLPSRRELAQVFAIIVLVLYGWTILWFLWKLPSWRVFLTAWEILGVLAFALVVDLAESLLVMCIPVILALCLPKKWFRGVFVARGAALVLAGLGYLMFLDEQFKNEMSYPRLSLPWWLLALPMGAVLLAVYAAGRLSLVQRILESLADRATIFLYVMLPLSVVSMLVLAIRRLA